MCLFLCSIHIELGHSLNLISKLHVLHLCTYFFINIVGQERHEPFIEGSVFEGW